MSTLLKWLLPVILIIIVPGCTKEPQDIEAVSVTSDLYIEITDTIKPQFTVYRLDSFQTSGSNTAIIGTNADPVFGRLNAQSFCRFKLPTADYQSVAAANEYFDSIVLVMHSDGSYYGDTLSPFKIIAEPLQQEFDIATTTYYNHNTLEGAGQTLGNTTVIFRPNADDSIRIKLSNTFGSEIFSLYKQQDSKIKSEEEFQRYFKGLNIKGDASNNVIYRFGTADSTMYIRLYYHEDQGQPVNKFIDFSSEGGTYQFNQLTCDVSGTTLAALLPGKEIISTALNNQFFVNDLAGIGTEIKFPSVSSLAIVPNFVKLGAATLKLKPVINSYTKYALINLIGMNVSTEESLSYSPLYASDNTTVQNGNLYTDILNPIETGYTYDLTALLSVEMYTSPVNSNTLTMRPISESNSNSFPMKRLVAADCFHPQQPSVLSSQLLFYKH